MAKIELSFHNKVSLVKSGCRISAGVALLALPGHPVIWTAGIFLIIAEVLGILEEVS